MAQSNDTGPVAVLFDVDGTLVDTNYLNAVTWWEAFSQAGHDIPMAQIHRAIGIGNVFVGFGGGVCGRVE